MFWFLLNKEKIAICVYLNQGKVWTINEFINKIVRKMEVSLI